MCEVCLIAKPTRNRELGPVDTSTGSNLPHDVLESEEPAVLLGYHPDPLGEGLRQSASTPPDVATHVCTLIIAAAPRPGRRVPRRVPVTQPLTR